MFQTPLPAPRVDRNGYDGIRRSHAKLWSDYPTPATTPPAQAVEAMEPFLRASSEHVGRQDIAGGQKRLEEAREMAASVLGAAGLSVVHRGGTSRQPCDQGDASPPGEGCHRRHRHEAVLETANSSEKGEQVDIVGVTHGIGTLASGAAGVATIQSFP